MLRLIIATRTPQLHWSLPAVKRNISPFQCEVTFSMSRVASSMELRVIYWFITVRKRNLGRLCFYTCLSVILFIRRGCPGPCPGVEGVQAHAQGSAQGGVQAQAWKGVSRSRPEGGSRPRPREGVSRPMPRGLPGGGVSRPRPGRGFSGPDPERGCPGPGPTGGCMFPSMHWGRHPPPPADGYCCRRYASYWNEFLFLQKIPFLTKSRQGQYDDAEK